MKIDKIVELLIVDGKANLERANFSIHEGFIDIITRVRQSHGDTYDDLLLGTVRNFLSYGALSMIQGFLNQ